jgi:Transposase zinc-binding domain/Putative transposase
MNQDRLEVADVFRTHEDDFLAQWGHVLSRRQKRAFADIRDCRTAALGGHVEYYDCGHRVILYNSCTNRSCPKCQGAARARWLAQREADLLPVEEYFHVVFTLPQQIAALALQNAKTIYTILFKAVAETMLTIAADPQHLGATIGFLAVLHSWGQKLNLHPHIHCVVPGGGISSDHSRWIALSQVVLPSRRGPQLLLPQKVLDPFAKGVPEGHTPLSRRVGIVGSTGSLRGNMPKGR